MLGLDGGGKTTILYQLKIGETVKRIPTLGFNVETVTYKEQVNFTIWDMGGQDKIRILWKYYFKGTDVLIFVVDSNDRDIIKDAEEELAKILKEEELKDCFILVLANKQDLNGALIPNEVEKKLGMEKFVGRKWLVQGTSAKKGQGIKEVLDRLASFLI